MKALDGVRILDFTHVQSGPTCTQLLAWLGADVIKVERPGQGDDSRAWGPPWTKNGRGEDTAQSSYFLCCNRNKKSIIVDIAASAGQAEIRRLADGRRARRPPPPATLRRGSIHRHQSARLNDRRDVQLSPRTTLAGRTQPGDSRPPLKQRRHCSSQRRQPVTEVTSHGCTP